MRSIFLCLLLSVLTALSSAAEKPSQLRDASRVAVESSPFFPSLSSSLSDNLSLPRTPPMISSMGWKLTSFSSAEAPLDLHIALKFSAEKFQQMHDMLLSVSSPESSHYGHHASQSDLTTLFGTDAASRASVLAWLGEYDIPSSAVHFTSTGDMLRIRTTVGTAERMLNTKYYTFTHVSGKVAHRVSSYDIPQSISNIVSFVAPTVRIPRVEHYEKKLPLRSFSASPFPTMDPAIIKEGYGTTGKTISTPSPTSTIAVANFLNQNFSPADLSSFLELYSPESRVPDVDIIGPNDPENPTREASLDVQAVSAMAPGAHVEFWSIEGAQPDATVPDNEPFLELLLQLASTEDKATEGAIPLSSSSSSGKMRVLPKILSISYGDDETTVSPAYAERVNVELMKLGLRGVSVFIASGDGGVSGPHNQDCPGGEFVPVFPASSPYATAVGGTTAFPEIGTSLSGGGFSRLFSRPSWQDKSVLNFLANSQKDGQLPETWRFKSANAAYPDLAAQSLFFPGIMGGEKVAHDGTSVSAPLVAGVFALLNNQRFLASKSPLGFLNPLIYGLGTSELFNDITQGYNPGCDTKGFTARVGWDPVTGMGSPNFPALSKYIALLP